MLSPDNKIKIIQDKINEINEFYSGINSINDEDIISKLESITNAISRNDILDNVEFFKSEVGRCVYMTSNEETKIIDEIDFFVDLIVTMYEFERKVSNNG